MPMSNYPNPTDNALPLPRCPSPPTDMPITSSSSRHKDDPESRRRRKEYDRDRDRDSSEKLPRSSKYKYSSSSSLDSRKISSSSARRRSSSRERTPGDEREREREREKARGTPSTERTSKRSNVIVPEMSSQPENGDERAKSAYPTFSKAHSREAVGSREQVNGPSNSSDEKEKPRNSTSTNNNVKIETPTERLKAGRTRSGSDMRDHILRPKTAPVAEDGKIRADSRFKTVKPSASGASLRRDIQLGSEVSSMPGAFPDELENKSTPTSSFRRTASTNSQPPSTLTQTTEASMDSDATSVAPDRKHARTAPPYIPADASPPSATDSQPRTPTPSEPYFPSAAKATPVYDVGGGWESMDSGRTPIGIVPPPPPPPPPPMAAPSQIPRVDYLLKHGGLPHMISKRLVQSPISSPTQQYSSYHSPQLQQNGAFEEHHKVFGGLVKRLDDYMQVLRCNGSIAVATGYRSVARRLLDKLSQVFARDISSQQCDCVMCKTNPQLDLSNEEDSGISWGEILELVSGRRELPQWPPFIIQAEEHGLGINGSTDAPMQKIDIDVPDEYREHYKRQNQKTKLAVQSWLEQQPIVPTSPPEEADEDTLMFAMMTKLDSHDRNLFIALMHGQTTISDMRAPTPAERPTTSPALKRTRRALQRLYRLGVPPRDSESAMYLLNNPQLHGMLATLAEVNEQEWDILISGRFDGFLWSGAEMAPNVPHSSFASPSISRMPSRNANASPLSRNTTPFSGLSGIPSRGPTPFGSSPLRNVMSPDAYPVPGGSMWPSRMPTPGLPTASSGPAPVQLDEETEIAVLAELERNIYTDMERLEDAFEHLHGRAEQVRQLLLERSAGLGMQAQLRRGPLVYDPGVRLGTPASGFTNFEDEEDDDGLGDTASLAPDDSASQISFNRRVRKRRERQTPAPVEEEDEAELGVSDRDRRRETERRRDGRKSVTRR